MGDIIIAKQGQIKGQGDELALNLKVFAGEVITAFERAGKALPNHITKTIESGKSAQFPVFGRAVAKYLKPGKSLDELREAIPHNERVIQIDGLLTADQLITDIYDAMSHYDVRQEYAKQMGEALALSADGAILAEIAKLALEEQPNLDGLGTGTQIVKQGTTGVTEEYGKLIIESLLELKAKWGRLYVPESDRFVYMTPEGVTSLIASKVAIDRDYGAIASIVDGTLDRLAGFKIIEVPHLTMGGADKTGMVGANPTDHSFPEKLKQSLNDVAFVAAHRTAVGTLKLKDLALEQARRPEYQADQIIAKYAMGHGGLRPEASAICVINKAGKI